MTKRNKIEIFGDLGPDDSDSAVATLEAPPPISEPEQSADQLINHIGTDMMLSDAEWTKLLTLPGGSLLNAVNDRKVLLTVRRVGKRTESGYLGHSIKDWIIKNGIEHSLGSTATTWLTMTLGEALATAFPNLDELTTGERLSRLFGIDFQTIEAACRSGEIRTGATSHHLGYLPGRAVADWLREKNIECRFSFDLAAMVASARRAALTATTSTDDADDSSPFAAALDRIEQQELAEIAEVDANLQRMMRLYREILQRREAPLPNDDNDLVMVSSELHLDRAQVQADICALSEIARLTTVASDLDAARLEVATVTEELKAEEKRAKETLQTLKRRQSSARNRMSDASRAPSEIFQIRQRHQHLFATNSDVR